MEISGGVAVKECDESKDQIAAIFLLGLLAFAFTLWFISAVSKDLENRITIIERTIQLKQP